MRTYRYARLDPTGNITCLVLDRADPEDERILTRELLGECEQVAYLEKASGTAAASVRLMGGEFCGNASMAAAAWLVRDRLGPGESTSLALEVSGAAKPVTCGIRRTEDGFEGTVEMPDILDIRDEVYFGIPFTAVRMEGIVHLICRGAPMEEKAAEELLPRIAALLPDKAAGLLQWDPESGYLKPLVYVRDSGSLVWEHGCGSGSAAVGAAEALLAGNGTLATPVRQPGGTITVKTEAREGKILSVTITGLVCPGEEKTIRIG